MSIGEFVILLEHSPDFIPNQTELSLWFYRKSTLSYSRGCPDIVRHHGHLNSMVVLLPEVCPA